MAAHGTAAGRLKADLLTVMLGVEEWQVRRTEDGGRSQEYGVWSTEYGVRRTEDGGRRTKEGGPRTEEGGRSGEILTSDKTLP